MKKSTKYALIRKFKAPNSNKFVVVGTLTAENDADYLYVTPKTTGDQAMTKTQFYVLDEKPGRRFDPETVPYRSEHIWLYAFG